LELDKTAQMIAVPMIATNTTAPMVIPTIKPVLVPPLPEVEDDEDNCCGLDEEEYEELD